MKIVSFEALPFHKWVLESTVNAARLMGHEVIEIGHQPKHHHDWWTGSPETAGKLKEVLGNTDFVLTADYPYAPLKGMMRVGAKVVALRHSLASRGNTYEKEQFDADILPVFSMYDREKIEAARKGLLKKTGWNSTQSTQTTGTNAGCPWASPVLSLDRAGSRLELRHRLGLPQIDDGRRIVAVATTWNPWTSLEVIKELAANKDWIVVWRPHWAAAWRRPEELDQVRAAGAFIDDPMQHPSTLLLGSSALVGDVSGVVLLATLVYGDHGENLEKSHMGGLPIVLIDPEPNALVSSGQLDADGPEWTFRDELGPRLKHDFEAGSVRMAVTKALEHDEYRVGRCVVANTMTSPYTMEDSPMRLVRVLEQM